MTAAQNLRILCPNLTCQRVLAVPSAARGKTVRCRNCGTNIRVPFAAESIQKPVEPSVEAKTPTKA